MTPGAGDRDKVSLSREDEELWERVQRSVMPLKWRKGNLEKRTPENASAMKKHKCTPSPSPSRHRKSVTGPCVSALDQSLARAPVPAGTSSCPVVDRRIAHRLVTRRILRGRKDVDSVLDLHGLYQDEAMCRLNVFLTRAQARDCRVVLVITGKGRNSNHGSGDLVGMASSKPGGVLWNAVRHWLELPSFSALVSAYSPAHRRHGGDGAIYVRLRRRS